jgi:hypothetical protein
MWITILIILGGGVLGGLAAYGLADAEGRKARNWFWCVLAGIVASAAVPVLLYVARSEIVQNLQAEKLEAFPCLVLAGLCLLAGATHDKFIRTMSARVLKLAEEANEQAGQAKDEAHRASDKADASEAIAESALAAGSLGVGKPPAGKSGTAALAGTAAPTPGPDAEDPWKGAFGGASAANGRTLEARIHEVAGSSGYWRIDLTVRSTDPAKPLQGDVAFFLHPTFREQEPVVPVDADGVARLALVAWGAFTVGAITDQGKLELDLAENPDAIEPFRSR